MNASLAESLKQLRLSGMVKSLDVRLQEAASNRLTHAEFLELPRADCQGTSSWCSESG